MTSDGAKLSKGEINVLVDANSDAKMSADPMTTDRELYSSFKRLLEQNKTFNLLEMAAQVSVTIRANRRLSS